jgi:hypothetical protein
MLSIGTTMHVEMSNMVVALSLSLALALSRSPWDAWIEVKSCIALHHQHLHHELQLMKNLMFLLSLFIFVD